MSNWTTVSTFMLLDFSDTQKLQILHIFVFLVFYLTTVTGNLLIIALVVFDHHLHTPMYFFLVNLAVMDLGTTSTVIPKSIINSLTNNSSISYSGCAIQVFFFFFFATSDFVLLTTMSYDRYVAICDPLQYNRIMHKTACIQIAAITWIFCIFYASLHTGATFANTFCSNAVPQFFCEVPALLKISCSNIYLVELGVLAGSFSLALGCFIYIIITYVQIFSTVLRIPSTHGQRKALSTCLPHLAVVSMFLFTSLFAYAKPPSNASSGLNVVFSVIYIIIPPMLNPFIYSMRNREIKAALWNLLDSGFSKCFPHHLL